MNQKVKITWLTSASGLCFCLMIMFASLTPLSEMGKAANQFNSAGMWESIGMALFFYIVPLVLYLIGLKWVKILMAVLCSIGWLIFFFTLFGLLMISIVKGNLTSMLLVMVINVLGCIINIIWFVVAFQMNKDESVSVEN